MSNSSEIIISDTSCLILLYKINRLELLREMADRIFITAVVRVEFGKTLTEWIEIQSKRTWYYTRYKAYFRGNKTNQLSV